MTALKPRLPEIAHLDTLLPHEFAPDARIDQKYGLGLDLSQVNTPNIEVTESFIKKSSLIEANITRMTLFDVIIEGGDWSGAQASSGGWLRVQSRHVRMAGIDLSEAEIKNVHFVGCKLDLANFRFAKLTRVVFEDCSLTETDFQGGVLNNVRFENSVLDKVEFAQVKSVQVDFRTSRLLEVRGWQFLNGALLDSAQLISVAPQLAAALGVKIEDEH